MENEDLQACRDFPLWAEYHALERARQDLVNAHLRKLTTHDGEGTT